MPFGIITLVDISTDPFIDHRFLIQRCDERKFYLKQSEVFFQSVRAEAKD